MNRKQAHGKTLDQIRAIIRQAEIDLGTYGQADENGDVPLSALVGYLAAQVLDRDNHIALCESIIDNQES